MSARISDPLSFNTGRSFVEKTGINAPLPLLEALNLEPIRYNDQVSEVVEIEDFTSEEEEDSSPQEEEDEEEVNQELQTSMLDNTLEEAGCSASHPRGSSLVPSQKQGEPDLLSVKRAHRFSSIKRKSVEASTVRSKSSRDLDPLEEEALASNSSSLRLEQPPPRTALTEVHRPSREAPSRVDSSRISVGSSIRKSSKGHSSRDLAHLDSTSSLPSGRSLSPPRTSPVRVSRPSERVTHFLAQVPLWREGPTSRPPGGGLFCPRRGAPRLKSVVVNPRKSLPT